MKNVRYMLNIMAALSLVSSMACAENGKPGPENQKGIRLTKHIQPQINSTNAKIGSSESEGKEDAQGDVNYGLDNEHEVLKPLDLSIPFQANEHTGLDNEHNQAKERKAPNLFSTVKNKQMPVKLDGGFLMSQEPEAEKKRSLDGAGIRLNLNP